MLKSMDPGGVPEWLKGTDCKSVGLAYVGSNPTPSTRSTNNAFARTALAVAPDPVQERGQLFLRPARRVLP